MSTIKEEDRKGFLSGLNPLAKKVTRPALSDIDAIGNKTPAPSHKKREKKKALTQWVQPEVIQQIKLIAAEEGKQQQDVINEALNMVFAKYRKAEIA
jgi:hypothetical protein